MITIDHTLLQPPPTRWTNLGDWQNTQDYVTAAQQFADRLGQWASLEPGQRILDVGFGNGDSLMWWLSQYGVGQVVGLELNRALVVQAQQRITALDVAERVQLHWGTATDLSRWREASFDHVLSLDSAYHYQPRLEFFRHSWRVLRPDGRLTVSDLAVRDDAPRWFQQAPLPMGGRFAAIPAQNWLTARQYEAQLGLAGFQHIVSQRIDEQIFSGFARFASRHALRNLWRQPTSGWANILGTAVCATFLSRYRWLEYRVWRGERR